MLTKKKSTQNQKKRMETIQLLKTCNRGNVSLLSVVQAALLHDEAKLDISTVLTNAPQPGILDNIKKTITNKKAHPHLAELIETTTFVNYFPLQDQIKVAKLVLHPDVVKVELINRTNLSVLEITIDIKDRARLIGREGHIIKALKSLINTFASEDTKYVIDIIR